MQRGYFFYNDNVLSLMELDKVSLEGTVVYEVLRVIDGVPLFFDDHFARLEHSCSLSGFIQPYDKQRLYRLINDLIERNCILTGNIMLKIAFQEERSPEVLLHFIPHKYPSQNDYMNGVSVGFLKAERNNPEAKIEQNVRNLANAMLYDKSLYEVLLVDHNDCITEGSRSNVFFVKDDELYTAPQHKVLTGITMAKVIGIAKKANIPVNYSEIKMADLGNFQAIFLTGTSPKILPVAQAGNIRYEIGIPIVKKIMGLYEKMMETDISDQKDIKKETAF
ncbi:MAG: aminotransferase class IV family protein [Prolixibacteraceae bacterium]|nr:aminotransferase class IV family protein [Prolixibacteraceae bacterium]